MRLAPLLFFVVMFASLGCGDEEPKEICEPGSCESLGYECGSHLDDCGEPLECGECADGYTCDGDICIRDCEPETCETLSYECGRHEDGCGAAIDCGECSEGFMCQEGVCVEEPCESRSCEELAAECGVQDDGCGEPIDCGSCPWPLTCEEGSCIAPPEPPDVLDGLRTISDLEVEEIPSDVPETRAFTLDFLQPEDHADPDGATFMQKVLLVHRSKDAPVVFQNIGYGFGAFDGEREEMTAYLFEPAVLLEANQLLVEHRFYGESIAEEPRWEHLTIEQSAADSHRIVEALGTVYPGPWIGSGASKGGMTAIFHNRFFPEDLDAIVPYVAPISFGISDARYVSFMEEVGPEDGICRERVKDMAVEIVERRDEAAQYMRAVEPEAASIETEVLEALVTFPAMSFHLAFWQYWGSADACEMLPQRGSPIDNVAAWVLHSPQSVLDPWAYDPSVSPYSYQVANQLVPGAKL